MMIKTLTLNDKEAVKILWKENPKNLSIPFNKELNDILASNHFYGIYQDDSLICMGGFKIMKRNPEIRVVHLCTQKKYRNQNYGFTLLKHIAAEAYKINPNLEFVAYFREGAKNNTFWSRYLKDEPTKIQRKTIIELRGILDYNKFDVKED